MGLLLDLVFLGDQIGRAVAGTERGLFDLTRWITGDLVNIRLANRERDFAAIGYVKITMASGTSMYIYS